MPAPDITLPSGYVLITDSASALGLLPVGSSEISFGTIAAVNDLTSSYSVADPVMYSLSKSERFMYGSTIYVLIKEEFISGTENPIP